MNAAPVAPLAPDAEHVPGFRARRGQNWLFLGMMYGFFYMSRYNFSAISAGLCDVFGWSNKEYGAIVTSGVLVYGLAVFFNGPLADRIGGKRALLLGAGGAAVFNLLFGACYLFLDHAAVVDHGKVLAPARFAPGMSASTMIATFSSLWACNHYFQSFGALSIVKINAAWFRVRERGTFAGIFGAMIQGGRLLAFSVSPLILTFLPWQYCFWIPAAILVVMIFVVRFSVENSPAQAGFPDLDTGDGSAHEPSAGGSAEQATFGFILRKVFAQPASWLIALSSMCIGMVRNSVDHWWAKYISTMFAVDPKLLSKFGPFVFASWAMPTAAILGGLAAGHASDRLFASRRAPVICFAFLGQAACLALLGQVVYSPWAGCAMLAATSFFIQSAHGLVGGAASMDFGGKKAAATAAGLFDGAQYLAAAIVGYGMGALLDHYRDAQHHEYAVWPYAPLPFALLGALLISRLWNATPSRGAHGSAPPPPAAASPRIAAR